uniref:Uncharacterized protein n=1 Tax=Anguilla anguilla TaxID=7936 RepID=A0A0E9RJU3_ANGAN
MSCTFCAVLVLFSLMNVHTLPEFPSPVHD